MDTSTTRDDSESEDAPWESASEIAGLDGASVDEVSPTSWAVAWGPAGPASVVVPLSDVNDRLATSGSAGTGPAAAPAMPTGAVGDILPDLGRGPGVARVQEDRGGADPVGSSAEPAPGDPGDAPAGRPSLREGNLDPDWESIDGELRSLLGRMARLETPADAAEAGRAWLVGIGSAALFYFWHRRSSGDRARPGRPVGGAIDPWPLGPP